MSTAHLSGIDLIKLGNEGRVQPVLNKYWTYIVGGTLGFGIGCAINFGFRRPYLSGIQKHALSIVVLTAALNYTQKKRAEYLAEKDAVLLHYIELHPDDFPTPERKKVGELLENWVPIR